MSANPHPGDATMEENKPARATRARVAAENVVEVEPSAIKRVRKPVDQAKKTKLKQASPAPTVVVLQRAIWGGLFGLVLFDFTRYESLLQRKENTVMQEISLSGIFLVEVLVAFVAAFALCQVLKLWEPKEPVEVLVKQKADGDADQY